MADYSMANRKIAYTLGRGRAYIFDMSSTSGYMGEKYFLEFGPRFFDMSSASGYVGEKYFQEFGPRFLGAYPLAHTPLREVSKERGSCTWPYVCVLPIYTSVWAKHMVARNQVVAVQQAGSTAGMWIILVARLVSCGY